MPPEIHPIHPQKHTGSAIKKLTIPPQKFNRDPAQKLIPFAPENSPEPRHCSAR